MNANTLNNFRHTLKQSSGNHKPHRHRKTHGADDEVIAQMKLKMAKAKAKTKHKRVIAQARLARNNYTCLGAMNMGDITAIDLFD